MQSNDYFNKSPTIVTFNGHLEFGTGRIFLDKKSLVEYPIPALLIATRKTTSFFECQQYFDEKQDTFIKSGGNGIDACKIVRLFIDKSGFYIYLETSQKYIYLRRAIHVEIGTKTLQVITEFDGHYYGILVWIYDVRIGVYTSFIDNFYRLLCFRLLVSLLFFHSYYY